MGTAARNLGVSSNVKNSKSDGSSLKSFILGALGMRSHSFASESIFPRAARWLLMVFFEYPSLSFWFLYASSSWTPIWSSR